MAETLYIRLGSQAEETIHWLIADDAPFEIIASGEISGVDQLAVLTEKALQRNVVGFVPGCDVTLKSLCVPAKSKKAMLAAAPYMLEENLAQDVEELFFAYANLPTNEKGENCFVAVVDKQQMTQWLSWLDDANIACKTLLPDFLALPFSSLAGEETPSGAIVSLGQHIVLRQALWKGLTVDESLWPAVCDSLYPEIAESDDVSPDKIQAYSAIALPEQSSLELVAMPEELPLALLAQYAHQQKFNLLQGQFQRKNKSSNHLMHWRWAAGIAAVALLLNITIKATESYRIANKIAAVDAQIIETYKKAFPKTKRVRINTIKSQLKSQMAGLGNSAENGDFLVMLEYLRPAFKAVPELKPQTLKYDGKKNEVRIQAEGKDYQTFEKFGQLIKNSNMTLSQGSLNNQGDKVVGSLSITKEKGRS